MIIREREKWLNLLKYDKIFVKRIRFSNERDIKSTNLSQTVKKIIRVSKLCLIIKILFHHLSVLRIKFFLLQFGAISTKQKIKESKKFDKPSKKLEINQPILFSTIIQPWRPPIDFRLSKGTSSSCNRRKGDEGNSVESIFGEKTSNRGWIEGGFCTRSRFRSRASRKRKWRSRVADLVA